MAHTKNNFGNPNRVFIAAEISANHGQNFKRAVQMIKVAKLCGADAVKFQTYTPDTITLNMKTRHFIIKHPTWGGQSLYQLYQKAYTPWSWFKKLKAVADDLGIAFFSTAFDPTSVDFLENLGVFCHKIASFELVDIPLIEYAAKTHKHLILSTGMATLQEIKDAVASAKVAGTQNITLLKCISSYPADPAEMNLRTIPDLQQRFRLPIGISDHTLGIGVSTASVALGVRFIEKHFTLSRHLKTPDSFFSLEPDELKALVSNVRMVEQALGKPCYGLTPDQRKSLIFRRSLFAVADIQKGECLSPENVRSIRPADGLKPKYLKTILGKTAVRLIKKGTPLSGNLISKSRIRRSY